MRAFAFGITFLSASILWSGDSMKDFLQEMPKEQKSLLGNFLHALTESSAGYVLYGEKPMSIELCETSSSRILGSPSLRSVTLIKGKEFWEDLNLATDNKEYILTFFDNDAGTNIVCINRKVFLQTVNDNLSLFQYVLGPSTTAETLLKKLISSKNQLYSVLNHDQTLLEILLGHGKQNAIVHSRMLDISRVASAEQSDEFPLLSKKLSLLWPASSKKYRKPPSFGFHSINEEEAALNKMVVSSEKIKPFTVCPIPDFACVADSEETKTILSAYEQTRSKIVRGSVSKNFLEETLRKLFSRTNNSVEIPSQFKRRGLSIPANKEEMTRKLIEIIHKKISVEPYGVKKFQQAFLQGAAARENGKKMPIMSQFKRSNDIASIRRDLECCKNLEQANAYFNHLSTREDLTALIPNEIYYKILKSGKGNAASHKTNNVSFQYSFQILGDQNSKDAGIIKGENLGALIPGVAYALIGMQQGEERVVYIHPKHAYGEDTYYPPNISVVVQLRLLDFKEGEQGVAIFPPHQLEQRDYKDLLAKFEVLRSEEIFEDGVEFWDSVKKSGDFIDFQTFHRLYASNTEGQSSFLNKAQEEQFVMDLEYQLLSLQTKD